MGKPQLNFLEGNFYRANCLQQRFAIAPGNRRAALHRNRPIKAK